MRIIYIARFDAGGNEDENAIAHALTQLGHDVQCIRESMGHNAYRLLPASFVLFHKWSDLKSLRRLPIPKVLFYFDLVDWPDPTLEARCAARRKWMEETLPHVDLGFLSDGDWVARDTTGKLVWLPQGADERTAGFGANSGHCTLCNASWAGTDLLFTGISGGGGQDRISFVEEMKSRYGRQFTHIPSGIHGRALADAIAHARIVVAPDSPVSDKYWSNRVYLMLGLGAFLLHPYCERLAQHYQDGREIIFYRSREHLHALIDYYLPKPELRQEIAAAGLRRTLREHTYTHRVRALVQTVQDRLSI